MKKNILALGTAMMICLLSASCNQKDATSMEVTDTLQQTDTAVVANDQVVEEQAKVIDKVQIVHNEKEFYEKVCTVDPDKGMLFKGQLPAIVDFYADWCGPCQQIAPYLVEFAEKYAGQIIIYKVNVDKHPDLAEDFKISGIPHLLFFKPNTKPVESTGSMPKDELEKAIQYLLLK